MSYITSARRDYVYIPSGMTLERRLDEIIAQLEETYDEKLRTELARQAVLLRNESEQSKRDQVIKAESEKSLLQQNFAEERLKFADRLKKEYADDLEHRLKEARDQYTRELDNMGKDGLTGQLKVDFHTMVEQEREKIRVEEKERLSHMMKTEKEQILRQCEAEKGKLTNAISAEKTDLLEDFHTKIEELEAALVEEREKVQMERQNTEYKLRKERESFEREKETLRDVIEEEISKELQARMEEEFLQQIERIKVAFEEERAELEGKIGLLQGELQDMHASHQREETFRQQLGAQAKEGESRWRQHVEDSQRNVLDMHEDKEKMEELVEQYRRSLEENAGKQRQLEEQLWERERQLKQAERQLQALSTDTVTAVRATGVHAGSYSQDTDRQAFDALQEEKQNMEQILGSTQEKMRDMIEQTNMAEQYKAELTNWELEKSMLHQQLELAETRLAEANTSLSLSQSEHMREVQGLRERSANHIEVSRYNDLNEKYVAAEKRARDLEASMEERATESSKLLVGTLEDYKRKEKELEDKKDDLARKLDKVTSILDEQVEKYKKQLQKSSKVDLLVKDLYIENAHLMTALQQTEQRQKEAEKRVYTLEDKCVALTKVLNKICPIALAS